MSYISDVAKSISKTIAGEGASITKAFSREAFESIGASAVNRDILKTSQSLINDALSSKVVTKEAFEAAQKADGFDMAKYAKDIVKNNGDNEAFQKAATAFKKKSMLYDDFSSGAINEAQYFGRDADKGIGALKATGAFFKDAEYGKTRMATVAGGALAASVGVRTLQGGNLTTTAQGERNIAGIPFI